MTASKDPLTVAIEVMELALTVLEKHVETDPDCHHAAACIRTTVEEVSKQMMNDCPKCNGPTPCLRCVDSFAAPRAAADSEREFASLLEQYREIGYTQHAAMDSCDERATEVLGKLMTLYRAALSQPAKEQEPFAWAVFDGEGGYDLYLAENNDWIKEKSKDQKYGSWYKPLFAAPVQQAKPCAVFDGYIDGSPVIKWTADSVPVGTEFYATPVQQEAKTVQRPPTEYGITFDQIPFDQIPQVESQSKGKPDA